MTSSLQGDGASLATIARNAFSLLFSQAATWSIAAVMLVVGPRFLGEGQFGGLSFATTYVGFFTLVGLLGTHTFIVKSTARDPSSVGLYVYNALLMKGLVAVCLSGAALTIAVALDYDRETLLLIGAACLLMIPTLLNDAVVAGHYGLEHMARPAMWTVVQAYVTAALCLVVIAVDGGVVAYGFALVPAALLPLYANSRRMLPELLGHRIDLQVWRRLVRGGFPYLVSNTVLFAYGSADLFMLRPLAGNATVGWYALAYRWVNLPTTVAATAIVALFPSLAQHGVELTPRFFRTTNLALRLVAFVTFPLATGIALVAGDFIGLLYGGGFRESIPLVVILALALPIIVVDMVLAMVLVASDRQMAWLVVGVAAAVFNPLLNLAAIPLAIDHYENGAIGAASVTFFTELLMTYGFIRLRPKGVLDRETAVYMLRCVLASLAIVGIVVTLGEAWLPVRIASGMVAYAAASLVLGTMSALELGQLRAKIASGSRSRPSNTPE